MMRIQLKSNLFSYLSLILSFLIWSTPAALFAGANETSPVVIPKTIVAIWKAIDSHSASINQAIKENKLNLIHEHAFAIRDLTHALPTLSGSFSKEQKKSLQNSLAYVNQLAIRLDKAGDANNQEGVQASWTKLQKILTGLREIYSTNNQGSYS